MASKKILKAVVLSGIHAITTGTAVTVVGCGDSHREGPPDSGFREGAVMIDAGVRDGSDGGPPSSDDAGRDSGRDAGRDGGHDARVIREGPAPFDGGE